MIKIINIYIILLSVVAFMSCTSRNSLRTEDDPVLSEVYGKQLKMSEVSEVLPPNLSDEDSLQFVKTYLQRWVADELFLKEAESKVPAEMNMEKLVRDYRESLIMMNYENLVLDKELDTVISDLEFQNYYQQNGQSYLLKAEVARIILWKPFVSDKAEKKIWDDLVEKEFTEIELICQNERTEYCFENLDIWLTKNEIFSLLNENYLKSNDWFEEGDQSRDGIFLFLLEVWKEGEVSPLEMVQSSIRRAIIHERRGELLIKKRAELYENEVGKPAVKIYY